MKKRAADNDQATATRTQRKGYEMSAVVDIFGEDSPSPDREPPEFTKRERHKIDGLLARVAWLEKRRDEGSSNPHLEQEAAALLWLLAEVGAICGLHISDRIDAANEVCVLDMAHLGNCEGSLR